ncbi:MAG: phosphoenolpyruvate--protein phosphotransferase [Opitutae bacterium]|jgi:phosphotransferase system enzyme I (PtsI)|nr:phosphoenolpyruvate--protein phosphotransferase [Opitutae bacterium]
MTEQGKNLAQEVLFQGIPASAGVAHGRVFKFSHGELKIPKYSVSDDAVDDELQRFEESLLVTREQIGEIRNEVAENLGSEEARIFDAHILVLEDQAFIDDIVSEVRTSGDNVELCLHRVSVRYLEIFSNLEDEYLKDRATDIQDVTRRMLRNLLGLTGSGTAFFEEARILVSDELTPSDAAALDADKVLGIATDFGGRTSHAVIMARANGIPAVVGLGSFSDELEDGDELLLDGYDGTAIANPSEATLYRFGKIKKRREEFAESLEALPHRPAVTPDGKTVQVYANVESVEEIEKAIQAGAEGVGLFRSEAVFLKKNAFPCEKEQFEEYRKIVEAMGSRPITIRTLDIGGDKVLPTAAKTREENPFMGLRAIRYCLRNEEIFRSQLKAILRASNFGKVRLLYPMITGLGELLRANEILADCKAELDKEDAQYDHDLEVGVMIETPSAASICELFAEHCSFFSIGTNDLVQYMLAVDRINNDVAYLYEPCHPAVLRAMRRIFDVGKEKGIPVGVCGEIAADPNFLPVLLGMGVDELSVAPPLIPELKYVFNQITFKESATLVEEILNCWRSQEILQCLKDFSVARLSGQD